MRILACYALVFFFSCYAYKRWFVSLLMAIALMAVLEHPDMPKSIGGIQGFNVWNFLFLNVFIAWWLDKKREQRELDWPRGIWVPLIAFFGLIVASTLRLLIAPGILAQEESTLSMVSEYVVNCLKWPLPGLLLFDGCRERKNVMLAIFAILSVYFLLGAQVVRWMPLGDMGSDAFTRRSYKICQNEIGYNRVTLSMMLGGGSWAVLSTLVLAKRSLAKLGILMAAGIIFLGQALTGGRTGYGCWLLVGLSLCVVRWRKLLLLIPVAIIAVFTFLPAVRDRLLQGIVDTGGGVDQYEITSGRNIAWPYVLEHIGTSIVFGHGRQAMATEGIRDRLWNEWEESFPHPHNAYLEALLDNGLIGLVIVLAFFYMIVRCSLALFKDKCDPLLVAVGGMCNSLVLGLLFGSFGGQTFYPREGSVCMWATIGLMFRLKRQHDQSLETGSPLFPDDEPFDDDSTVPTKLDPLSRPN